MKWRRWITLTFISKDAFAGFSTRRHVAAIRASSLIHTPQFMLNGTDFKSGLQDRRLQIALV